MADYEYDSTGVDLERPVFAPIPEGEHTFRINKAEPSKSGKGYFMVICECDVIENIDLAGKRVKHYVTFLPKDNKGAGMAIHFLKAIGQPWEGKFSVTTADWVGAKFVGTVKHETYVPKEGKNAGRTLTSAKIVEVKATPEIPF